MVQITVRVYVKNTLATGVTDMTTLYYVHDPMCSWCWGFSHTWQCLQQELPSEISIVRLLGGLAADTDILMPIEMRGKLKATWEHIAAQIPGVEFNFDFWTLCTPRRATYPACRAVIAARQQGSAYDITMTRAIQQAYYLQARNPSEDSTLIALSKEIGLDTLTFQQTLHSETTHAQLRQEIAQARYLGVDSFPSLVLEHRGSR